MRPPLQVGLQCAILLFALSATLCAAQTTPQPPDPATPQSQPQTQPETLTPAQLLQQQQAQQNSTGQGSIPTFQANAHLVVLDINVTDHQGRSVHGLKASDFTLLENGLPQTISSFEEHTPAAPNAAELDASALHLGTDVFTDYQPVPNNSSVNVLLLDALDTPIGDQMYLHSQMIEYLKGVPPGTPFAVFLLDTRLHLLQGFSSDPKALQNFASSKQNMPEFPLVGGPGSGYMRQTILFDAFHQLARYLGGIPGRKNLIWCTGNIPVAPIGAGGPGDPFPDISTLIDSMTQATDVLTLSRVAVYPVDVRGLMTDPAFSAANRGAGRAPLNPANFEILNASQHQMMDQLAQQTGGKAFYNTNGLKQALADVVDTGANYYTVSYSPTNTRWNGSYRAIKILVDQPADKLAYREGYYAQDHSPAPAADPHRKALPLPYKRKVSSQQPTSMQVAMSRGALPPSEILFKALVTSTGEETRKKSGAPMPKDNNPDRKLMKYPYRTYQIDYAVDGSRLRFTTAPDGRRRDSIEFVALLYDQDGDLVNVIANTLQGNLDPRLYAQLLQRGLDMQQSIAVPAKGTYFLRLGVHDISSDRIGALEIPVSSIKILP